MDVSDLLRVARLNAKKQRILRHETHLPDVESVIRYTKLVAVRIDSATNAVSSVRSVRSDAERLKLLKEQQAVRIASNPVSTTETVSRLEDVVVYSLDGIVKSLLVNLWIQRGIDTSRSLRPRNVVWSIGDQLVDNLALHFTSKLSSHEVTKSTVKALSVLRLKILLSLSSVSSSKSLSFCSYKSCIQLEVYTVAVCTVVSSVRIVRIKTIVERSRRTVEALVSLLVCH